MADKNVVGGGVPDTPEKKRRQEKETVGLMIELYCRGNRGTPKGQLCPDCAALRDYADFEIYDGAGKCLYTTASALPADRSGDWGVLRAARQETGTVLRAEGGGLTGARPITTQEGEVLGSVVFRLAVPG